MNRFRTTILQSFRPGAAAAVLLAMLGTSAADAAVIPASIVCPDPAVAKIGTAGDDVLRTSRPAGCLLGDSGNDRLKGGMSDDVLDPGPGIDRTTGGGGDDILIVRSACEIGEGEILKGGSGNDTLRSPFTRTELEAMGVKVRSIEVFEIVPTENSGACAMTDAGMVCTCCDREGFAPEAACTGCASGRILFEPRLGDGDMEESRLPEASCDVVPTCADLDCGPNGSCMADPAHGPTCVCESGWAGNSCESCQPLYELTEDGRCVLGRECGIAQCSGHGRCVADADGEIGCDCDPGFEVDESCGKPDFVIGGPKSIPGGGAPVEFGIFTNNGGHCGSGWNWSVQGGGSIAPLAADSSRATYTPPSSVVGHIEAVVVEAECDGYPPYRPKFETTVTSGPNKPHEEVGGSCASELEPIEEAVIEWLDQQGIQGATLAVTYYEKVMCLRGFGNREVVAASASSKMEQCTPMRVASVSKPFTRAAIRGNLWGQSIPPALGGGVVDENTPVLPIVASTIGLGVGNQVPWQAPASIYTNAHPVNHPNILLACNSTNGLIHPNWNNVTINNMLGHTAGFAPNANYSFAPGTGTCTNAMGEVCGSTQSVGDPTIQRMQRIANDLGLSYGLPNTSDIVQWLAGTCPYDLATAGRNRYSNVGFTVAGRVIENLSNKDYDEFVTDFLTDDGVIGLDKPGSPIVYLGQSYGGGPADFSLPGYMNEAEYYTWRADTVDVTAPSGSPGSWTFPNLVAAPYGGTDFPAMDAHGGLVMNALALAKFGSTYLVKDGLPRSLLRGGAGLQTYFPTDRGISHAGLLFGTSALIWELPTVEPNNTTNPNGAGCLIPADMQDTDDPNSNGNGLDALGVAPCPVPQGIRISVIFNGEQRAAGDALYFRGRHDWALLAHMLRKGASDVGTTASDWAQITPLSKHDMRIGCDVECEAGFCFPWTCGNGVVDDGEECDDGDHEWGDACRPDCTLPPDEPNGYLLCDGETPGNCLGGPCAARDEKPPFTESELLDPYWETHPDGDYSPHTFCHDSHTSLAPSWEEATCVKTSYLGKNFGVCMECGVDTMTGCTCPAPNQEDGGCNGTFFDGYECIGGRCWQDDVPQWMCTADCNQDIYGDNGYCDHDDEYGAVCMSTQCDEPVPGYCSFYGNGQICDIEANGCDNDSCCIDECGSDAECHGMGYSTGHQCIDRRCKLP